MNEFFAVKILDDMEKYIDSCPFKALSTTKIIAEQAVLKKYIETLKEEISIGAGVEKIDQQGVDNTKDGKLDSVLERFRL